MIENERFGVAITSENFPDKVFREYVATNFDKDSDGILLQDEISTVTEIFCYSIGLNNGIISIFIAPIKTNISLHLYFLPLENTHDFQNSWVFLGKI